MFAWVGQLLEWVFCGFGNHLWRPYGNGWMCQDCGKFMAEQEKDDG